MAGYRLHPIYSNRLGLLQNVEQIANLVKQFGNCLDRKIKGAKNYRTMRSSIGRNRVCVSILLPSMWR